MKRILALAACVCLAVVGAVYAMPGKPDFSPHIYADGVAWGTKVTVGQLPAPNDHNMQSFDKLYVIVNSNNPDGQLPVSEAGPGNPDYNGGRWYTWTAMWTNTGLSHYGTVPILKSYEDLMEQVDAGYMDVMAGPPDVPNAPPPFFLCPLLPVKD